MEWNFAFQDPQPNVSKTQRAPRNRPEERFVLRFLRPTVGIGEVFFLWRLTKDEDLEAEKLIELCGPRVVVSTEHDSLQRRVYQQR